MKGKNKKKQLTAAEEQSRKIKVEAKKARANTMRDACLGWGVYFNWILHDSDFLLLLRDSYLGCSSLKD